MWVWIRNDEKTRHFHFLSQLLSFVDIFQFWNFPPIHLCNCNIGKIKTKNEKFTETKNQSNKSFFALKATDFKIILKYHYFNQFCKTSIIFPVLQTTYPLSTETIITHRDKKAIINSSSFTHSPKSTLLLNNWHMEKLFSHWWLEIDPDLQPLEKNVKLFQNPISQACKKTS